MNTIKRQFIHPNDRSLDDKLKMLTGNYTPLKQEVLTEAEDKAKRDRRNEETDLQSKCCKDLREYYPKTLFISDFAAGLYLSDFLANIRASQACLDKYLDLTIMEPRGGYFGLIIEIKTIKGNPFKVNGVDLLSNPHNEAQFESIKRLCSLGYLSLFGVGYEHIMKIAHQYMNMPLTTPNKIFTGHSFKK